MKSLNSSVRTTWFMSSESRLMTEFAYPTRPASVSNRIEGSAPRSPLLASLVKERGHRPLSPVAHKTNRLVGLGQDRERS
jgi:hypothetical protein